MASDDRSESDEQEEELGSSLIEAGAHLDPSGDFPKDKLIVDYDVTIFKQTIEWMNEAKTCAT